MFLERLHSPVRNHFFLDSALLLRRLLSWSQLFWYTLKLELRLSYGISTKSIYWLQLKFLMTKGVHINAKTTYVFRKLPILAVFKKFLMGRFKVEPISTDQSNLTSNRSKQPKRSIELVLISIAFLSDTHKPQKNRFNFHLKLTYHGLKFYNICSSRK